MKREDGFVVPLGVVLTSAHLTNGEQQDSLEQTYFTLNSDISLLPDAPMKLIPFTLGEKLQPSASHPEQAFKDPITQFRCLYDNDMEILLLIGKEENKEMQPARLSFLRELSGEEAGEQEEDLLHPSFDIFVFVDIFDNLGCLFAIPNGWKQDTRPSINPIPDSISLQLLSLVPQP